MDPRKKIKLHVFSPREGHQSLEIGFWQMLLMGSILCFGILGMLWIVVDPSLYERLWKQSSLEKVREDNENLSETLEHVLNQRQTLETSINKVEKKLKNAQGIYGIDSSRAPEKKLPETSSELLTEATLLEQQLQRIVKKVLENEELLPSLPVLHPVQKRTFVSRSFGKQKDPFTETQKMHYGIDFPGDIGDTVITPADGIVKSIKRSSLHGLEIVIDHGFSIETRYTHLEGYLVDQGKKIPRGTPFALLGSSGKSTGPHLHYELMYNERNLDPALFIIP